MKQIKSLFAATYFMVSLMTAMTANADQSAGQTQSAHGDDMKSANGVIGVIIQVAASRIGEPAALYVMNVRQDGPAHAAGLHHGDEIVAVNGTPVAGKSYEQVVAMIRGESGTPVKLEVKGTRELSIMRVASETLSRGEGRPRTGQPENTLP